MVGGGWGYLVEREVACGEYDSVDMSECGVEERGDGVAAGEDPCHFLGERLSDGEEHVVGEDEGEALVTFPPRPLPPLVQIREGCKLAVVQTPPSLPEGELRVAPRLLVPLEERERLR